MLVLTHKAKEDAPPFSANVLERSGFQREQRPITVRELIACYNRIVSQRETDPSLRIVIA